MKIDLDYMANLLNVFVDSNKAQITISTFEECGIPVESTNVASSSALDENFLFHIQLALENQLVSNQKLESHNLESLGIIMYIRGVGLTGQPIRLTQKGHDFANALDNKEVLSRLKSEFKEAPFKMVFDTSQKLLEHVLKKKLDSLV
ncbi:DUF2513 domain-containing protein [Vibrio harveyi]|uniref:DUF2513 domain-containing protein n=1 Tax=Vibrio harveyi TaxID=669 RepID=UPI003BB658F4|nr:DUF2513 domain-containing protein [Vibrio harveyi]